MTKTLPTHKKLPRKARVTTQLNLFWLETAHFCPEDHNRVLLRWNRPSGPVYRTGYFNDAKLRFVGDGDVDFQTQPDDFAGLNDITATSNPVAVIPCHTPAQAKQIVRAAEFLRLPEEEKVEAIAKASDAYFDSINGNHEAFKASEHARSVLAAMGMGGAK